MTAFYDERLCEPGRRASRWLFGGLGAALLATTIAVGAEIASDRGEGLPADKQEDIVPEQAVLAEHTVQAFVYADLKRKAELAQERVYFSGEPADVQVCQDAVAKLAEVSIGPVMIDCTP